MNFYCYDCSMTLTGGGRLIVFPLLSHPFKQSFLAVTIKIGVKGMMSHHAAVVFTMTLTGKGSW